MFVSNSFVESLYAKYFLGRMFLYIKLFLCAFSFLFFVFNVVLNSFVERMCLECFYVECSHLQSFFFIKFIGTKSQCTMNCFLDQ